MRSRSFALLLVLLSSCAPKALDLGPTVPTVVQLGTRGRSVLTLTDLDDVRDIAVTEERIVVATDRGILLYPRSGDPTSIRLTHIEGLPSDDALALATSPDGRVLVATATGLAVLSGDAVSPMGALPPVGRVRALHIDARGVSWACGDAGIAKLDDGNWVGFGEPVECTTLAADGAGGFWAGTTNGLLRVEGDIVREHAQGQGIPEGLVRGVAPLAEGKAIALVQGASGAKLGYFDGYRWSGYALEGVNTPVVALTATGTGALLLSGDHAFLVGPEFQPGAVAMTPVSESENSGVRSYRARLEPADERLERVQTNARAMPEAASFAAIPEGPTLDTPRFYARVEGLSGPRDPYFAKSIGNALFVADHNRGVWEREGSRWLRTKDLVAAEDLQIGIDERQHTWILAKTGEAGLFEQGRVHRVPLPEGAVADALAGGARGVFVAVRTGPLAVRLYHAAESGWETAADRTLTLPTALLGIPFMGVSNEGVAWLGLRIAREQGEGGRAGGVAVIDPRTPNVTYHRRGVTAEHDGADSLVMPDEVTAVDLSQEGYAWLPSISGAVRVGNHQAVVFGESRGVRGEVVTDIAVGLRDRVWIAAAEGLGYYESQHFEFNLPAVVREARPTALAVDVEGNLWGAGGRGAIFHDGTRWLILTEDHGLPTRQFVDVETAGTDLAVWLLASEQIVVLRPGDVPQAAQ